VSERQDAVSALLPSRRALAGGLALAGFGAIITALLAAPGLEVVGRGHFVSYTEHEVVRVRAFDSFNFLAAPETRGDHDLLNGIVLALLGGVAALAALLAWSLRISSQLRWFFTLTAFAAAFLSVAEMLELDETLGYNVQWLDHIPGLTAENLDLIVLGPPTLVFVWYFRRVILSSVEAAWFWATGITIFIFTLALDVFFDTPIEDALEVVASLFLLAGFTVLAADQLQAQLPLVAREREWA
jgi:hypothetical protein